MHVNVLKAKMCIPKTKSSLLVLTVVCSVYYHNHDSDKCSLLKLSFPYFLQKYYHCQELKVIYSTENKVKCRQKKSRQLEAFSKCRIPNSFKEKLTQTHPSKSVRHDTSPPRRWSDHSQQHNSTHLPVLLWSRLGRRQHFHINTLSSHNVASSPLKVQ